MPIRHIAFEEYADEQIANERSVVIAAHWREEVKVRQTRRGWLLTTMAQTFAEENRFFKLLDDVCPATVERLEFDIEGLELDLAVPIGTFEKARQIWQADPGFAPDESRAMLRKDASNFVEKCCLKVRDLLKGTPELLTEFDDWYEKRHSTSSRTLWACLMVSIALNAGNGEGSQALHSTLDILEYSLDREREVDGEGALPNDLTTLLRWHKASEKVFKFISSAETESERIFLATTLFGMEPQIGF